MKIISSMKELLCLECDLAMFILSSCPWIAEGWQPENVGYIYLLDDGDIDEVKSICAVPCIDESSVDYQDSMVIDLETFDLWEAPSFFDAATGYWNVVTILGQEYGCTVFLSSGYVASIPPLQERLKAMQQMKIHSTGLST